MYTLVFQTSRNGAIINILNGETKGDLLMIGNIDITGIQHTSGDRAKVYIERKIGRLYKYIPKNMRNDVRAEVHIADKTNEDPKNPIECSVFIALHGGKEFKATNNGRTLEAAVDTTEAKIRRQLRRYHDEVVDRSPAMRMASRLKRALGR